MSTVYWLTRNDDLRCFTWDGLSPKIRRKYAKRLARVIKRQAIEARQVARAVIIVNRAPTLIHNGKVPR